jgi:hypothetical protein
MVVGVVGGGRRSWRGWCMTWDYYREFVSTDI